MQEWWSKALELMTSPQALSGLRAGILLMAGLLVAKVLSAMLVRVTAKRMDTHQAMLVRRGAYYFILVLFIISALRELGFQLGVLLGAAGVLSVAIGFASQTSASNLISGLFLIGERPFGIGDVVKVGASVGEVISIDLLSVKLRTFDNLFVRIPNEQLIKSEVTTLTRFPIRRYDLQLGVAYKEDLEKVRKVLFEVAERNPLCLEEPEPLFIFQGFGDSSLNIQFSVWAKREQWLDLRNTIAEEIKGAFDRAGIEIPFPHRTLYSGSITEPFPVRVVERPKKTAGSSGD